MSINTNNFEKQCLRSTEGWVTPETFKEPEWVRKDLEEIENEIKNTLKDPNKKYKVNEIFKHLLEKNVLKGKIKPKYPLTKGNIAKIVDELWRKFPESEFIYRYFMIERLGFFLSTLRPAGFNPESLKLPEKFIKRKEELLNEYEKKIKEIGKDKAITWIDKEFDKLTEDVIKYWEENGIDTADIVRSKSRGSASDIRKMLVAVGLSITSKGTINDIILNPQVEGLKQTQMFHYSSQAIQALYAKSSETAVPGYLARKISTISEPINLSETLDCKSTKYLEVIVFDKDVLEALDGRKMNNGKLIDAEKDKNLIGKKIKIRSPLFCKAKDGICATCWNKKMVKQLNLKPGAKIGLLAATSIGNDALVNLTLKKSHTGLSLNLKEVDLEKDIFMYAE